MKVFLLIGIFAMLSSGINAQDSWVIKLNSKQILAGKSENEKLNAKTINKNELLKKGVFQVMYKEVPMRKDWTRSILLFDENDSEIMRIDSLTAKSKINTSELKAKFAGKKEIRVYTIAVPSDPEKAALVRVRRVHLGTLELK